MGQVTTRGRIIHKFPGKQLLSPDMRFVGMHCPAPHISQQMSTSLSANSLMQLSQELQYASAMADGINSTWMTPSASKKMNIITFPADWQTLNFLLLQTLKCFHCIPASLTFYRVKWCVQVSLAVNSHPTFNHRRCKKKPPNSDFYALLSHIRYTMCMHVVISMLFMDMVLTIVTKTPV